MKLHAPVTPPGRGQTVACLTHLKSLRPLRTKDPRVGFHLFQPLASDRKDNKHVYAHSFNLAKIHTDLYIMYMLFCNTAMSFSLTLLELSQHRLLDASFTGVLGS